MAQRLIRLICESCKEEATYLPDVFSAASIPEDALAGCTLFKGAGCDKFSGSGYRGRQGLYEGMRMSRILRRMVLQGASTDDLKAQAIEEGMVTLRQDGLLKVKRGITTLDEVLKETAASGERGTDRERSP